MKVSFLVTYYNQKEYVKQSLDSILAIDKPCDWEILIGDDGSSDGTIEEVNKYVKKHPDNIKLYVMPRENGKKYDSVRRASANRLNILEHSTGDIFCVLDGDDYYCDTSFLSDAVKIFEKYNDISVIAFGFKYDTDGVTGQDITLPTEMMNQRVDKKIFLKKFYIPAGGCVHRNCFGNKRTDFIKRVGYFDDNNIIINSLNYGEIFSVNRAIYAYRQTGQSVYTSMNALERAVLNVQGLDVDIKLSKDGLKSILMERYASSLILMYIWKSKIRENLGSEKCKKYEDGCSTLIPSYCYNLLKYEQLPEQQKDILRIELKYIMHLNIFFTIKQVLKYWFKGVLK
ncbi:glycosyltransferase family 2 protein [Oliverpabstia intestinalis]|uniref:glycosyltransferase family 2 protein n=1 Tax=Oliverpabstia intestinalis TaxID=2606633 RepID=UPI003F995238